MSGLHLRPLCGVAFGVAVGCQAPSASEAAPPPPLPERLSETGLFDESGTTIASPLRSFSPQYPLWTDGADKERWVDLPPDASIDASDPDAWQFPVGTRFFKQFSFGRPLETRVMERTSDGWRFATYVWQADGADALLAPAAGRARAVTLPDGSTRDIMGEHECRLCHDNGATPVLGFSGLQLSTDRDPNAPHARPRGADEVDLSTLLAEGLLVGWEHGSAPRVEARTATERAAVGYLHGNCAGCHRPGSAVASNGLLLQYPVAATEPGGTPPAIATTVGVASRYPMPGRPATTAPRIAAGAPEDSVLLHRVRSTSPASRMPPMDSRVVDEDAVELLTRWIDEIPTNPNGTS